MFDIGFPRDWSSLKKLIWLKAAISGGGASAVWKTVTGTLIHITDALASPMRKCEVTLEPIQDLHGQDAPYPAGGGKNLLHVTATSQTINGVTYTVNDDGTVSANGSAGGGGSNLLLAQITLPEGTYKVNGGISSNLYINIRGKVNSYWSSFSSFNVNSGGETLDVKIYISTSEQINVTFKPMICLGTETDTTYSPYSNICPITGWTGCEVTRTGENLYPYTTIPAYNYAWYSGSKALADATNPVFLKGGKKYAVSADQSVAATTSAIVRAWRADGTILENAPNVLNLKDPISGTTASYQASPKYYQLSTPNYAKPFTDTIEPTEDLWVDMRCSGDNRVGNDPMLQVGDSRTDYEPYSVTTLSVTFPDGQTVYGGTDELISGELVSKLAEIDLGLLTWTKNDSSLIGVPCFYATLPNVKGGAAYSDCSHFKIKRDRDAIDGDCQISPMNGSSATQCVVRYDAFAQSDATTFGNAMSGVQLVYELATPIEIQLTPQQISTLKGVNNVWSNSNGDTTIIYKAQSS